jgi:cytochrome o ubiquinol oxidase subunit 2
MIYTMAGMETQVNLLADEAGTYRGLSGNFSGDGFSDMVFDTDVLSADDYRQWVRTTHGAGGTLDAAAYATLMHPSEHDAPRTYGAVSQALFEGILAHPGEAPTAEQIAHFAQPTT